MLIDEAKLEDLMCRALRKVLDERQMVVSADALSKDKGPSSSG